VSHLDNQIDDERGRENEPKDPGSPSRRRARALRGARRAEHAGGVLGADSSTLARHLAIVAISRQSP
jgi:hypothetical protein